MDKRYQVFISSTYADLKDERRNVFQALMEMDCIPAGMELFPASDDDQWEFIKRVIDDCDYYILVIGGRYGSMGEQGISYTEKEFDYALANGLKVIALVHDDPGSLPLMKSEIDPSAREKLNAFREKVCTGRLVKFWKSPAELAGLAVLSLTKTIKSYPALGWVRPTSQASNAALTELNELRKENEKLRRQIKEYEDVASTGFVDIAGLDHQFEIEGDVSRTSRYNTRPTRETWKITVSWRKLFSLLAPYLLTHPHEHTVQVKIAEIAREYGEFRGSNPKVKDQIFQTISIHLKALGLVKIDYLANTSGSMSLFWSLTKRGDQLMTAERIVRIPQ